MLVNLNGAANSVVLEEVLLPNDASLAALAGQAKRLFAQVNFLVAAAMGRTTRR
jgi:hypothetical protein